MLTIALAQHDFLVGDIQGNLDKALGLIASAREAGADLLLFPEMALTGYPPEDLLLRPGFLSQSERALTDLVTAVVGIDVVVGHPWQEQQRRDAEMDRPQRNHDIRHRLQADAEEGAEIRRGFRTQAELRWLRRIAAITLHTVPSGIRKLCMPARLRCIFFPTN